MTERKPPGTSTQSWVDRLIHEAQARGEFDNLPGAGKPLPGIDKPLEEDWWLRQKIRDENLPNDALLPPVMQLRREVSNLPETVRDLPDEQAVRAMVHDVNTRIADWIRSPSGPVLPVARADAEAIVQGWREARGGNQVAGTSDTETDVQPERAAQTPGRDYPDGQPRRRRSWWRRPRR